MLKLLDSGGLLAVTSKAPFQRSQPGSISGSGKNIRRKLGFKQNQKSSEKKKTTKKLLKLNGMYKMIVFRSRSIQAMTNIMLKWV